MKTLIKIVSCCLIIFQLTDGRKFRGYRADTESGERVKMPYEPKSVFRLYTDDIEDTCTVELFEPHTLDACGFNSSHPLAIIIHGWSQVDGMMENWIERLASALKSSEEGINVVIADWLTLAHHHYPIAAQNTRIVGQEIAHLLRWLEDFKQFPLGKVHLIGYSLGAHISGFAGSNLAVSGKTLGRITGLDPAGPLFEGMSHTERLSPEDARFVDAIHTFTQERMGLSVGIQQPVAHFDFYPNGGSFQPGCQLHMQNLYAHLSQYGIMGFEQTVKCAHERAVHLFIDSLLNKDKQIMAYKCSNNAAFDKGYCLDCRKNRCNTLGYDIKKVRTGTSKRLFLKTRSHMPYKLFHYQFRIQFINQTDKIEPTLTVSLTGTLGESENLPITLVEEISGNKTFTFLITLDTDIGDLMIMRFTWEEGSPVWANMWSTVKTMMPWAKSSRGPQLTVGKITVKAGETQRKTTFCPQTDEGVFIEPSQEKVFVRCEKNREKPRQKQRTMKTTKRD
ncbi:hepatic triacylglycerol lipase isoform X1 [Puntigrus tetrazona]|uniref:hepatic triacylglycerol lipase isoform X1 n=1 Tax=Puntigrus tetrazona TaxID=1606681 RepID=UPI001C8A8B1F|nr:hepatic triacylglycerol lipase isoform X1 [Puntigrus tetrazona]